MVVDWKSARGGWVSTEPARAGPDSPISGSNSVVVAKPFTLNLHMPGKPLDVAVKS